MMPVSTTLYDKIEAKGADDAKAILENAAAKARALKEALVATAAAENDARLDEARRHADDRIRTVRTASAQQAKKAALERRKTVLDGLFADAAKRLSALPDERYADLVVRLVASEGLSGGELFRVAKEEIPRFKALFSSMGDLSLDLLAKRLGMPDQTFRLDPKPAPVAGGFVVVGRNFDLDRSFATLLADLRDGLEPELAEILFSTGA
jgi:vacuolar-type H+-ATPase subunit E/Vma4